MQAAHAFKNNIRFLQEREPAPRAASEAETLIEDADVRVTSALDDDAGSGTNIDDEMRARHGSGTNVDQEPPVSMSPDSIAPASEVGPTRDDVTLSLSAVEDESISDVLEPSPRDHRAPVVR